MSIGIIGGLGRMGRRLGQSLTQNNYTPVVGTRESFMSVAEDSQTIILSVKPMDIPKVCKQIGPIVNRDPNKLVISVAAGIPHDWYFNWFDDTVHRTNVVRIMPTYFVGQNESILGVECDFETYDLHKSRLMTMFNPKTIYHCSSISDMDVITTTVSCAPAIYARIYKSLLLAYMNLGLSEEVSRNIIQHTMTSTLSDNNIKQPDRLIDTVASPGGATAKGLRLLEDHHLDHLIKQTFKETFNRCNEIRRIVGDSLD